MFLYLGWGWGGVGEEHGYNNKKEARRVDRTEVFLLTSFEPFFAIRSNRLTLRSGWGGDKSCALGDIGSYRHTTELNCVQDRRLIMKLVLHIHANRHVIVSLRILLIER